MSSAVACRWSVVVALVACSPRVHRPSHTRAVVGASLARVEWVPGATLDALIDEPDGHADVLAGGRRVRVLEDEVELAEEVFASPVRSACQVATGWIFLADDGVAAFSPAFLGPLRRIGDFAGYRQRTNPYRRSTLRNRGRMALVDRDGVAWTSTGGPFERVTGLAPGPVDDVLFVSVDRGVALSSGSVVQCTSDGGRTWTAASAGEEPPLVLDYAQCPSGQEDPTDGGQARREPRYTPPAEQEALRLALVGRDPAWLDALRAAAIAPGAVALTWREQRLIFDPASGRELSAMPCRELDGDGCWSSRDEGEVAEEELAALRAEHPDATVVDASVTRWGLFTARLAVAGAPPSIFVVREGGGAIQGAIPAGTEHVAFADTRRGLAWSSPPRRIVRTLDGGAHWEEVPLPLDGDVAAAFPPDDDQGRERNDQPRQERDPWRALPGRCTSARCLVGATLVVRGWGPLDPSPRRALGVRATPAHDAGAPAAPEERASPEDEQQIALQGLYERVEQVGARVPRFHCDTAGRTTALPPLRPVVPTGVQAVTFANRTVDGEARGAIWRGPGRGRRVSMAWRSVRLDGVADASVSNVWINYNISDDFAPRRPGVPLRQGPLFMAPVAISRDHITFTFDQRQAPMLDDQVFRVTCGATRSARDESDAVPMFFPNFRPWLHRDGVFVLASPSGGEMNELFVIDLPRDGSVARGRRGHFGPHSPMMSRTGPSAIARRGELVGGAVLLPTGAWAFLPVRPSPDAAPAEIPWNPDAPVTVCAGDPDPAAYALTLPDRLTRWPGRVDHDGEAEEYVTLEVTATSTCVRALDVVTASETLRVVARPDGALGGVAERERSLRQVRCVAR